MNPPPNARAAYVSRPINQMLDQDWQRSAHQERWHRYKRQSDERGYGKRHTERDGSNFIEYVERDDAEGSGQQFDQGKQRQERNAATLRQPATSEATEPRPSMKAVTTIVTDSMLTPKMRNRARCQTS
ncbi:hypothetical protein P3T43_005677 [Paraburkholderia sp. GAS41]|uniref:hypothetical protein n=1 Tax=Paraburkholderia sp. GAS41 TaxID=3035134 RepID=UPI003D2165F8